MILRRSLRQAEGRQTSVSKIFKNLVIRPVEVFGFNFIRELIKIYPWTVQLNSHVCREDTWVLL